MRIVYLHQYFNTPDMKGGTRSYEMARRLVSQGHEVDLITSDRSERTTGGWHETVEAGIRVHWYPVPYSNEACFKERLRAFLTFAWVASRKASSLKGDVIFATSTPLTIALPGLYASWRKDVPFVFEVRDLWPELPIAIGALKNPVLIQLTRQLEYIAYHSASQVVALSPGMKEGIVRRDYPAENVHVIPNSSDIDLFSNGARACFRAPYDWLEDRPLVVYTGTLGQINGVVYFAELASHVWRCDPEVRFLIMGSGKQEDVVRAKAHELGVLNKNLFMMPPVEKNKVPDVLDAATMATSLFIDLKEMWANSANKFFDALASGTPVAINYGGWQADILNQSGAGIVMPARDTEAAAEQLVQKLRDKEWIDEAGKKARQLAVERFNREKLVVQLESVLLKAVRGNQ